MDAAVRRFYSSKGFISGPLTGERVSPDRFAMPLPIGESRLGVLSLALTRGLRIQPAMRSILL
ncbi:hypothetical protein RLV_3565 [Rhizobium leguminosarum bv. viciae]|nr:hypothetical protein RLV_3565 [Rhizobium leguminosarum bv. viciae]